MVTINSVTIAGAASLHQAEDSKQSQAVSEEDGKSSIALSV